MSVFVCYAVPMPIHQQKPHHKTRFCVFVASSIDGRISLSNTHPPEWTSKEDWKFFQSSLARMEAVVVGRNTYNGVAERLRKRTTFVLTHRVKTSIKRGSVTFVNPSGINLREMLSSFQRVGVLGGGSVYMYMLNQGMMDDLYVTLEPLVFGRGNTMFSEGLTTTRMRLLSVRQLNTQGTLLLHYCAQP